MLPQGNPTLPGSHTAGLRVFGAPSYGRWLGRSAACHSLPVARCKSSSGPPVPSSSPLPLSRAYPSPANSVNLPLSPGIDRSHPQENVRCPPHLVAPRRLAPGRGRPSRAQGVRLCRRRRQAQALACPSPPGGSRLGGGGRGGGGAGKERLEKIRSRWTVMSSTTWRWRSVMLSTGVTAEWREQGNRSRGGERRRWGSSARS